MDAFVIEGPVKLKGKVKISGSKNSTLPLLFASLLFDNELIFENVPRLWDVETTLSLLKYIGSSYEWRKEEGIIHIRPNISMPIAPYDFVCKMRAGILSLGALLAKKGEAKVSLPGGCAIGARPINYHIDAMEKMGISIEVEGGYIKAKVKGIIEGATIRFPQVSVTGTENILILATQADGKTVIENAACEPEVIALGEFLLSCGAKITGLGTHCIEVEGSSLTRPKQKIIIGPDRIETGTWISAAFATRSEIELIDCRAFELSMVLSSYRSMGGDFSISDDGKNIKITPSEEYNGIEVETSPYPGFPTDMQAQMMVNMCLAKGRSVIRETIFENRFMHAAELRRLGAEIMVQKGTAIIDGPQNFEGAPIMATDLRASASLVIAALCAEGTTKISRIYHLDRGYQKMDEKLKNLGVRIRRISE